MIRRSTLHKQVQDDDRVKFSVSVTGDDCPAEGLLSHQRQMELLRLLADQPTLALCGPGPFQTLVMAHNGTAWVVRLEAVCEDVSGTSNRAASK
jgi:hypothetical protein